MSRLVALTALLLAALFITGCGVIVPQVVRINPPEAGVVIDVRTGELLEPLGSGVHTVDPWRRVVILSLVTRELTLSGESTADSPGRIEARTAEGYATFIDLTVLFHIDFEQINHFYTRWGGSDRYPLEFVLPTVRRTVRDVAARYTALELFTEQNEIQPLIVAELEPLFAAEGLVLQDFIFRDVRFPNDVAEQLQEQLEELGQ